MGADKYKWHLNILPEDDATRQLANGWCQVDCLSQPSPLSRQFFTEIGGHGWSKTIASIADQNLDRFANRHVLSFIDSDGDPDRVQKIQKDIRQTYSSYIDRIFIIAVYPLVNNGSIQKMEVEDLKKAFRQSSLETIGKSLANEFIANDYTDNGWGHPLLRNNQSELARLRRVVPCRSVNSNYHT